MPFIVTRKKAERRDFVACLWNLLEQGVDLSDALRCPAPGGVEDCWVYVWGNRQDAEAFANVLLKRPRWKGWYVRTISNRDVSRGPLVPIEIHVAMQGDSFNYTVDLLSRLFLKRRFPEARGKANVFVTNEDKHKVFDERQWEIMDHVVRILTGVSIEDLDRL